MAQEGDIVFLIGGDVTGLTRAGQAGEKSLAEMERAAKTLERQIGKIGEAGVQFQREMNRLTGVTTEFSKSARDSAAAFEAFDKARAQVDNLRASIDPLFAASKRYEAALAQLDSALEMGAVSAREHAAMMDQLAAAYLRADGAADQMGGRLGFLGVSANNSRGAVQNIGYQIQDFAVQVGAGTSATQAFAQQFPQLASVFGPWGAAIGTAGAILIPLAGYFLSASDNAEKLSQALERQKTIADDLVATYQALRLERDMIQSGAASEAEQKAMNEITRLAYERVGLEAELAALYDQANANLGQINAKELERVQAAMAANEANRQFNQRLLEAIQKERARTEAVKLTKAASEQLQAVMNTLANSDISGPWTGVLGFIQKAIDKAGEYARTAGFAMSTGSADWAKNSLGFTVPGQELIPGDAVLSGKKGGGGGGENKVQTQLDALRQQLMTEEQLEMQSYAKRQEMLQQALDQRLLTQQEYSALMEQAQQAHSDKMGEIDVWRYGTGLDKASAFFGDMASAMQGGNEEMLKISKAFGAAQALISAWQGAAEALKLPFPQNLAAFAKVLATGLGAVNAIKGAGKGGTTSGGRAATSTASAAASSPLDVRLTGIGANDLFSGAQISGLLDRLSAEAGDRGYRLMVAQ